MNIPSATSEPERYKGRPLLIVLENYVLDCIGALDQQIQEGVASIVQKVWGGTEDWKLTVRQQLRLSDSIDDAIREMWVKNQQIARDAKVELHPVQFAKIFVDQNFADKIPKKS